MLPTDSKDRKNIPLARGCYDYFPLALAAVAKLSQAGNDKHNPGQPLHWSREKSNDHADCIARHQQDRGKIDPEDGFLHDVKVAWRSLAQAELALEKAAALSQPAAAAERGYVKRPLPPVFLRGVGAWSFDTRVAQRRKTPFPGRYSAPRPGHQHRRNFAYDGFNLIGWKERRVALTFPDHSVVPQADAFFNPCHDYGYATQP